MTDKAPQAELPDDIKFGSEARFDPVESLRMLWLEYMHLVDYIDARFGPVPDYIRISYRMADGLALTRRREADQK